MELLERSMSPAHKAAIGRAHKGNSQSPETRRKIARSMAGKANHAGKKHSILAKERISSARGSYDPIGNKKWIVTKVSGKTYRKRSVPDSAKYQYGRYIKSFSEWCVYPYNN